MSLTQIQKLQLNKQVDRILHAPGNQPAGRQQLEMAFVLDCSSDIEYIKSTTQDAVAALKAHDKIFQNVRSNVVYWRENHTSTETMPMSFIQMGKPFVDLNNGTVDKLSKFDELCAYLKLYHARRKYVEDGKDLSGKGFDPRKLLAPGFEAIKATVKEKMELFGSVNKA